MFRFPPLALGIPESENALYFAVLLYRTHRGTVWKVLTYGSRRVTRRVLFPEIAETCIATQASDSMTTASERKRMTYIAFAKMCMPKLAELFLRFKNFKVKDEIFVDETVEAVLSGYAVPIKLKYYECLPPSKLGRTCRCGRLRRHASRRSSRRLGGRFYSLF